MNKPATAHYEALRTVGFVILLGLFIAAPVLCQTSPSGGPAPVLTFTPGLASTVAGTGTSGYSGDGGPATLAQFNSPIGIARDGQGNLYIADIGNNVVRRVNAQGAIETIAGNGTQGFSGDGGPATSAQLAFPAAVAVDTIGNLYIADYVNSRVRKVDPNGIISTVATASGAVVRAVTADTAGNVYFASSFEGVWKVDSNGVTTKIAGNGQPGFSGDGGPAIDAQVLGVSGLAVDRLGNLYLAEVYNSDVRKIDTNGIITTIAGDHQFGYAGDGGPAVDARFNGPTNVTLDAAGNLYIADSSNNCIRKVNGSGIISTIAGGGNPAPVTAFDNPSAIALDESANLFVADTGNNLVRRVRVDSTTLDFGTVTVGQTGGPIIVIVSNAGNADLHVSGVSASASFGAQTTCVANSPISPGSECSVAVSFTPTLEGNITGTVTVNDDAGGNPHLIVLKGQGHVVPVASKLVFGTQFHAMPLNGNLGLVTVNATDANGNLATGFNGAVGLQLQGPAGFTPFVSQANASGGTVTFNLTSVALNVAGAYAITASSGGLTSAQASFSVTGNPDFAVAMSAKSVAVGQSGTGTITATVSPTNGFNSRVSLNCSGLPSHSTCSFLPASLLPDGSNSPVSSVLTISTGVATVSALEHPGKPFSLATGTGGLSVGLVGFVLAMLGKEKRHKTNKLQRICQLLLIAGALCVGLVGCGTIAPGQSNLTPSGSYTVTVTGSSNGTSRTSTFTLVVR